MSEQATMRQGRRATPEMIAAAWDAWRARHGGRLGPGPAFVEAINAALGVQPETFNGMPIATDDPAYHCPRCGLDSCGIRHVRDMLALSDTEASRG